MKLFTGACMEAVDDVIPIIIAAIDAPMPILDSTIDVVCAAIVSIAGIDDLVPIIGVGKEATADRASVRVLQGGLDAVESIVTETFVST